MIGNITKGNGFYGCVAYVLGKKDAQLINTNMADTTPSQLAWEFRKFANFNSRVQKPVLHLSFSPAPGDRTLDEWELCQIGQDLLDGLKLSNNQFILVTHLDAKYNGEPRPHAHMVINRVSYDGECNDDYLDYYRTEKVLRQVEKNYDLIIQPSSWEVERKKPYPKQIQLELETGSPNTIQQLQTAILTAAADKPAMPVFVARLLKDGIKADIKYTRTGKVKGISYGIGEKHFAGNDLGKVFTFNGLQKYLGVSYDHSRDKPVIESLLESFKRGRVIDDARVKYLQDWLWWREKEALEAQSEISITTTSDYLQSPATPAVIVASTTPTSAVPPAPPTAEPLDPQSPAQSQHQSPTTPIPTVPLLSALPAVPTIPPVAIAPTTSDDGASGEDAPQVSPANTDGSCQQQEYANAIAHAVRLLWQRQHQGLVVRGRKYDLQLEGDIIRIQRLTGEAIALVPLDANSQPQGIALSLDDVENFRQIQKILASHQQLQNKDGLEL